MNSLVQTEIVTEECNMFKVAFPKINNYTINIVLCYDVVLACFHPSWRLSSAGTGADIGKQRRKSSIASPSTAVDRVHHWHRHHDADSVVRRTSGEYLWRLTFPLRIPE